MSSNAEMKVKHIIDLNPNIEIKLVFDNLYEASDKLKLMSILKGLDKLIIDAYPEGSEVSIAITYRGERVSL